jgi:hypothetical protein
MKQYKSKYLAIALCAANATLVAAQETAAPDTVKEQAKVQLAFREVDASDALVGVSSVNYRDVIEKDYMTYPFSDLDAFIAGGTNGWGGSYLVLIDGVPRPVDNIKPELLLASMYQKLGLEYNESAIAIHRKDVYAVDEKSGNRISLLDLGTVIK